MGEVAEVAEVAGARTAREEIEGIISRVPETTVNKSRAGQKNAATNVKKYFDEFLAGGKVRGSEAKIAYIARQAGRSKEEIRGLIDRGPTEPPRAGLGLGARDSSDSVDYLLNANLTGDAVRWAGEKLAGLPGKSVFSAARQAVVKKVFTPASVAAQTGNEAVREAYGYRLLQASQEARANAKLLFFRTSSLLGTGARKMMGRPVRLFDINPSGELMLSNGQRRAFGDVAEDAGSFLKEGLINDDQHAWIRNAQEYIDDLARNYQFATGNKLIVQRGDKRYWPRFLKDDAGDVVPVAGRVGARQSPGQPRLLDTMQEGIDKGKEYVADPLEQLRSYAYAVNKMTRDGIFEQRLLTRNIVLPDGTLQPMAKRARYDLSTREYAYGKAVKRRAPKGRGAPDWLARRGAQTLDISEEAMRQLSQPMGLKGGRFLSTAEMVAAVPKLVVTGLFDTGQFFIQGLTLLGYRPNRWAKATQASLATLFSRSPEDTFSQWMTSGAYAAKVREAAESGMDVSAISEYYQAAPALGRLPVVGRPLGAVSSRFQAAFHAYMNVGRVEMYDAMAGMAKRTASRTGQSEAELAGELRRIARIADTLMGGTSTKGLGLSATQRQVENAFIFFAARYTRSVFGAAGHMAGSGEGAAQARRALGQMLGAGAMIIAGVTGVIGAAQGRSKGEIYKDIEKALDPRSGAAFMSIKFGDHYFGFGGGYRAALSLLINSMPVIPGREGRPNAWGYVMEDVASGKWGEVAARNPLVTFLRSKAAIPTGLLADYIEGQEFTGEEFSIDAFTEDPGRFAARLLRRGAPFPVQAFLEVLGSGSGVRTAALAGAVEFFGGREAPVSARMRLEEHVGEEVEAMREAGGIGGTNRELKDQFYGEGEWKGVDFSGGESPAHSWQQPPRTLLLLRGKPEYDAHRQRVRADAGKYNRPLGEFYEEEDRLWEDARGKLEDAWAKSLTDSPAGQEGKYYSEVRKAILTKFYTLREAARARAEEAGAFSERDREGPFERARDVYSRLLYGDDRDLVRELTGSYAPIEDARGVDWYERDRRMEYLVKQYGQNFVDEMEELSWGKLPKFEIERRQDARVIDRAGYWDVDKALALELGGELILSLLKEYYKKKRVSDADAKKYLSNHTVLRDDVLGQVPRRRLQMRLGDKNLDNLLLKWGYVDTPIEQQVHPESGSIGSGFKLLKVP